MRMATSSTTADYWVGVTIGEGSFGRVLYGRHKPTHLDVAIKVVEKIVVNKHDWMMQQTLLEQRLLQKLNACPYVIKLLASFHDSECLYLVMECALGGDLQEMLLSRQPPPLPLSSSLHYAWQILQGLEHIHAQNILHCDIKPSNILLTAQGQIRLADFGSAVVMGEQQQSSSSLKKAKARHFYRGTPEYASPELIHGVVDKLTVAVDLWSYGCCLYALFTGGKSPFQAPSEALVLQRIQSYIESESKDDLVVENTEIISDAVKQLILGLLDPDPSQRFGAGDNKEVGGSLQYSSIRSSSVWKDLDEASAPILPPEPAWLQESKRTEMRDGSLGWVSFLV